MLSPSEERLWVAEPIDKVDTADDRSVNERYLRGEGRIVIETNREKLPGFINLLSNPGYMDLRPFYQRRPRWDTQKQSLLIESFIMNIPVPPVFLYEKDYNSYEVMDGQQRISAIRDFYANSFKLKGLEMWPELNGRTYKTLPEKIRAGIDRRSITSIVLLKESTENEEEASKLRETVFERLNTGGIKLERQEIRNALYRGPFNDLLHLLAQTDEFRDTWGLPRFVENEVDTNSDLISNSFFAKMADVEIILRFFALRHTEHYRNGMQGFLDIYMRKASRFNDTDAEFLGDLYLDTIRTARAIYGELIFCAFDKKDGTWEQKPHKAFHDAVMIGISERLDFAEELEQKRIQVIDATKQLFIENEIGVFTGRGNTKQDILTRISLYRQMLDNVLAA